MMRWLIFSLAAIAYVFVVVFAEEEYANLEAGLYYVFNGTVVCGNGNPIGENAKVVILEIDGIAPNDYEDESNIIDGKFSLKLDKTHDYPTPTLELQLRFEETCGYDNYHNKLSYAFQNGSNFGFTYTLLDDDPYARIHQW